MRIRIVTYSTKPRGGVVHALRLAEALADRGHDVELWALSADGAAFFREPARRRCAWCRSTGARARTSSRASCATPPPSPTGMRAAGPADIHHAEDCLSARSLLALRAEGRVPAIVRTIHHVDDFASPVLAECQRASIEDVDHRICVSRHWADVLRARPRRRRGGDPERRRRRPLRRLPRSTARRPAARMGWGDRPTVLAVGGHRAAQGQPHPARGLRRARASGLGPGALLAIAGGETLFDYADYRDAWEDDAARLGLRVAPRAAPPARRRRGRARARSPTPTCRRSSARPTCSRSPPSARVSAWWCWRRRRPGLPAVVSDLPVLREFLEDGRDCRMVPVGDAERAGGARWSR